jgi:hypothetical protein
MDPMDLVRRLAAIHHRGAGSDAERRAARLLATELRAAGRRGTRTVALWVRPAWATTAALICALAVAGSVVSVGTPVVGVALAGAALVLFAADVSGVAPVLRRLTFERATQDVVSPDPRADLTPKVHLILTANVDAPAAGLAERGALARAGNRIRAALRGYWPGLHGWTARALVVLAACCAARVATGEDDVPDWLGVVQLVPTVVLLAALGLFLDQATAEAPREGAGADASAAAVVLAAAARLDRRPPRHLAVDVVLAGAGAPHALGLRRWIRARRRGGVKAEEVAVVHVAACGTGRPAWWTRDGLVVPLRFHPRLVALAEGVARAERHLQARAHESRGMSGARAARGAGWPAIALGALDADGTVPLRGSDEDTADAVDPQAVQATLAFVLALVAALDADLAASAPA